MRYVMTAIGGALVWWIALGLWLGWMSPGSAQKQTDEAVFAALVEKLTPICVGNFNADADQESKWERVKNAAYYNRDAVFAEQGWATFMGSDEPVERIVESCRNAIEASTKS